jgi:GxxExxY protein
MRGEIVYPDLSYKLVGLAFKVYNSLGFGCRELYVQRAYSKELTKERFDFVREREIELIYDGQEIGKYKLDFVIDNKIVVELKIVPVVKNIHIRQVLEYLNVTKLKLAILIYFTPKGVMYKRVVNPNF